MDTPLTILSPSPEPLPVADRLVVRYGILGLLASLPHRLDDTPPRESWLVIRTPGRGIELGRMRCGVSERGCKGACITPTRLREYVVNCGYEADRWTTEGEVLRRASDADIATGKANEVEAKRLIPIAREAAKRLSTPMKIVGSEVTLARDWVGFYFLAEQRVDFRTLVRELAQQLRMRVHMQWIGPRDPARFLAEQDTCGSQCCCQAFLKNLPKVNMGAAKVQKTSLDPSKISGRCGRLRCCLKYEEKTYEELRAKLPKNHTRVQTPEGPGVVVDTSILTQMVRVQFTEEKGGVFPVDKLTILAQPQPPQQGQRKNPKKPRDGRPPERRAQGDAPPPPKPQSPAAPDSPKDVAGQ